jgi:hypothetical protein
VGALLAFRPELADDPSVVQAQATTEANASARQSAPDQLDPNSEEARIARVTAKNRSEFANEATRRKLNTLIDVDFSETPLAAALAFLAKQVGTQYLLDSKALVDLAITSDEPVTLQLRQIPVEMALDLILEPLQLAYTLRSGVVIVTSQAEIDADTETRVYQAPSQSTQELTQLISSTIAPASWNSNGGLGVIHPFRDSLVVSQTPQVHRQIDKLLNDLEPVLAKGPPKQATEGGMSGSGYGASDAGGYGAAGNGASAAGGYAGYGSSSGGYGGGGARAGYGSGRGQPGYGRTGYGGARSQPGYGGAGAERPERKRGRNAPSRDSKSAPSADPTPADSTLKPAEVDPNAATGDAADPAAAKSARWADIYRSGGFQPPITLFPLPRPRRLEAAATVCPSIACPSRPR